jgi:hypothetical protein
MQEGVFKQVFSTESRLFPAFLDRATTINQIAQNVEDLVNAEQTARPPKRPNRGECSQSGEREVTFM